MEEEESSDSNSSSDISETWKQSKSTVRRFKGVIPQQNGHWGAQIYANHQRIWLGTFKSEIDAAMAYDSAAIKLRNNDPHRNFPWTHISSQEPSFQNQFTTEVVLNMIRDGSYPIKFFDFLRTQQGGAEINLPSIRADGEFYCTLLFEKELTPSDVGKLNRLVIPKRYAVKHFPNVPNECSGERQSLENRSRRLNEVQLEFYDRNMRLWTFRYCYWKSSQSFVFTRGWNKFVKKKGLKACDTIGFYLYSSRDSRCFGKQFLVIDVARKGGGDRRSGGGAGEEEGVVEGGDKNGCKAGFRLFGVHIE
ncbi:AP2/ERF and B3 domain-containing transcription factor At1g51120-like [Andrographis paniculata]|uniref:AP2/ERF and B3 domain-containing transcription factor At1g51120-like n=1 Tax=Andrographis paniculata TaxID=175694 RepID=UPI0021E8AF7B|nr:AP2/ERF and B3 domain-containing transcription factor At1g51120-like [Andrographis paniculata]